jgi:hypothetical protein
VEGPLQGEERAVPRRDAEHLSGVKAGTRTITVPLTPVGRVARSHRGKLKIQASLTVSGRTGTATTTAKV